MAVEHIPITEEELYTMEATAAACPELNPYMTAKGGVVIFNGPFPRLKAEMATLFIGQAKSNLHRLVAEVRRLKRELSIKDSLIGQTAPEMQTITIATKPPDVSGLIACTRCGRRDGSLVNIPGTTPGWVCADKCVRPWWNQGEVSSL